MGLLREQLHRQATCSLKVSMLLPNKKQLGPEPHCADLREDETFGRFSALRGPRWAPGGPRELRARIRFGK